MILLKKCLLRLRKNIKSNISIAIGSWGSYNECNERALGSKWLDLGDFDSWEEIEEELTNGQYKANYRGVICTAIFNCYYYVDDVYGIIKEIK